MAVVIRLQGLAGTASSQDIRKFFGGLRIPDGGVHIIGGELEEAFIIFGSDEDARVAMTKTGGYIKGSSVTLLLSSKTEMQNILESSTMNLELDQRRMLKERARHLEMDNFRRPRRSADNDMERRSCRLGHSPSIQNQRGSVSSEGKQLMLRGMPFSATEKDVVKFFEGLTVEEVVLRQNSRGQNNGNGVVTFASKEDAIDGLKRHKGYIGSRYVEIYTPKEWREVFGETPVGTDVAGTSKRRRSPHRNRKDSLPHGRSRSPLVRGHSASSSGDFCVLLDNLSYGVDKEDIKKFFSRARLESDQILYLLNSDGKRTRSAFVLFNSLQDYRDALDCDNKKMLDRYTRIRPISREKMISLLEASNTNVKSPERGEKLPLHPADPYDDEKICIYVKYLPFDVRKVEIMDFFIGFCVSEDNVMLLHDDQGNGLGEALVAFQSEAEAMETLSLNGRRFLGSEVVLKCISHSEMQDMMKSLAPKSWPREERYANRSLATSYDTDEADFRPNTSMRNEQTRMHRDGETHSRGSYSQQDKDGAHGGFGSSAHDGPTCIKLVNLPYNIKIEEVYDFCYGYKIIPGSVSLQYDKTGAPKGTATVVFESRPEALTAIDDLTGRPIGQRKIQLVFL